MKRSHLSMMLRLWLRVSLVVAFSGCSFIWGAKPAERGDCSRVKWLVGADFGLGVPTTVTALIAGIPCVIDVDDQSRRARAIHCGIAVVGTAAGAAAIASGFRGLKQNKRCGDVKQQRRNASGRYFQRTPATAASVVNVMPSKPKMFRRPDRSTAKLPL